MRKNLFKLFQGMIRSIVTCDQALFLFRWLTFPLWRVPTEEDKKSTIRNWVLLQFDQTEMSMWLMKLHFVQKLHNVNAYENRVSD